MSRFVLSFDEIDRSHWKIVGGKGAHLGELSRLSGLLAPQGVCVTTVAYDTITAHHRELGSSLDELARLRANERERISTIAAQIRSVIEHIPIPNDIADDIAHSLNTLGEDDGYAVRSSATAEDLPTASFAGQQDTFLNCIGTDAILQHVSRCWASLFTDRAVIYRVQHGFDHRAVRLAVVIQKMIYPQAAGVVFTADPVTGNRTVVSIDAGFGLGEAMVSGKVNADAYSVHDGNIVDKKIATKTHALTALKTGGTSVQEIEPARQNLQALNDDQIVQLARICRTIEHHFGSPQDVEWCLVDGAFHIVQSRPITTLFPIPDANDQEHHVYVSVGHQQMMTDPMKPLGLSLFQLTAFRPMWKAGGRLFVDVTRQLASPAAREDLLKAMGQHDPLMKDALMTIMERGDFIPSVPDDPRELRSVKRRVSVVDSQSQIENAPAIVAELIQRSQASLETLNHTIQSKSGTALCDFILDDIRQLKALLSDPRNMEMILAAIDASSWINDNMFEWLGEKNVADTLSQSAPNNITSEMGLALLDVADVIRPFPDVIEFLRTAPEDRWLDALEAFDGGQETRVAIEAFLSRYGMRCVGEIDITRTRWSEKPSTLLPIILSNIKNAQPNSGTRNYEHGRTEALNKERELLERLAQVPGGQGKANETKRMIDIMRSVIGYREYPKYSIVNHYFVYKRALLSEAEQLVQAGVIQAKEDISWLTFDELRDVIRTRVLDCRIIDERKEEHRTFEQLTPPRVITSDGEIIAGRYQREHLPADALVGLAVSSGVVEGRARVILDVANAELDEGDILVTPFTDPSWTTLFVSIKGLVTEVGGLMTHGSVIAREYGLPAVVGVEKATTLIEDGQRIRVNGTEGFVELL